MGYNEQQEAVMSEKFVLVVSDEKDGKHGEISELDTAQETERLVETLLEAGFEHDRIRVFTGSQAEFETVYRPVVNLIDEANQTAERARPASDRAEPEVVGVGAEANGEPVEAGSGNGRSMSSLFRSARDDKVEVYISASEAGS